MQQSTQTHHQSGPARFVETFRRRQRLSKEPFGLTRPAPLLFVFRAQRHQGHEALGIAGRQFDGPFELPLEVAETAQPTRQGQKGPQNLELGGFVAAPPRAMFAVFVEKSVEDLFARSLVVFAAHIEQRRQRLRRAGQQTVGRPAAVPIAFGEHAPERVAQRTGAVARHAAGEGQALRFGTEPQASFHRFEEIRLDEDLFETPRQVDRKFATGLDQVTRLDRPFGQRQDAQRQNRTQTGSGGFERGGEAQRRFGLDLFVAGIKETAVNPPHETAVGQTQHQLFERQRIASGCRHQSLLERRRDFEPLHQLFGGHPGLGAVESFDHHRRQGIGRSDADLLTQQQPGGTPLQQRGHQLFEQSPIAGRGGLQTIEEKDRRRTQRAFHPRAGIGQLRRCPAGIFVELRGQDPGHQRSEPAGELEQETRASGQTSIEPQTGYQRGIFAFHQA